MSTAKASSAASATPPPLLERADQLAALAAHLAAVRQHGRGRLIFVGGEAGVGKSSLVRRFCGESGQSVRILTGACDPLFTPRPLGPFLDIAPALGGDFARLAERGGRPYEVATALLRALATGPATIFIVEDIHWADEATLDVLRFLGRRIETVPTLMLVTYRDELDRSHPLRILLGELPPGETTARLWLAPLSPHAVAELAAPRGMDAAELYRKTAGNPFFVTEALAAGDTAIPPTVRDAVLGRVARLAPAAVALLEAVAVVPLQTELWLLEALAGDALDQLDTCLSSGMLAAGDGAVRFRHELARLAIEDALTPVRRRALHRRALQSLETTPSGEPDLARLVHHAEAAADHDAVLRYAPAAAARAAQLGAHREAAAHYARALRHADNLHAEQRAELLDQLSHEYYLTGQIEDAIQPCLTALAIWSALARTEQVGHDLRWLSRFHWFLGHDAEARHRGLAAVETLETLPPSRELAMAYGNLAHLGTRETDSTETLRWGGRALELAERLGDLETVCYVLNSMGIVEFAHDGHGQARLERSLTIALEQGYEEHAARAYANLAIYYVASHAYMHADGYLRDGIAYCAERDLGPWGLFLRWVRARARLDQGDWSRAAEDASAVLAVPWMSVTNRIPALLVLGRVRARRGDPGAAVLLDEARDLTMATGDPMRIEQMAAARAEWRWLQGDRTGSVHEAEAGMAPASPATNKWYHGEVAIWLWRGAGLSDTQAEIAAPYALEIAGDWQAAAAEWERLCCPFEQALVLMSGDEAAQRDALATFELLGAGPAAEIVRRRLRSAGVRGLPRGPRPATRANPLGLTNRQLEILELLAAGLHNAEIADRLSTTPKTAEHHVSAVLLKLHARTRAEAVRIAYQRGLITHTAVVPAP